MLINVLSLEFVTVQDTFSLYLIQTASIDSKSWE